MAIDGDFERHHGSRYGIAKFWSRPPVDHACGQMQQQIDQPRRFVPVEQVAKEPVLLRANAAKARERRKQRIEESRAHYESLEFSLTVMPGLVPGIHVFFRPARKFKTRIAGSSPAMTT